MPPIVIGAILWRVITQVHIHSKRLFVANNPLYLLCINYLDNLNHQEMQQRECVSTGWCSSPNSVRPLLPPIKWHLLLLRSVVYQWFYINLNSGLAFTVIRAEFFKMTSSSICTQCITSSSLTPYLTIYVGILYVKGLIIKCYISWQTLPREQKTNWPLHIPSLVFIYNATPHSITGYQPYKLIVGMQIICHL